MLSYLKILFTLAALPGFLSLTSWGQVRIAGTVTRTDGAAIVSASVTLQGTREGTTTDSLGKFQFITSLRGKRVVVVSSIGYRTYTQAVQLSDSVLPLQVTLQENTLALQEVVVSAGSFEASDRAKGAALTPMDAVTVAGSNADLAVALRSLPGAQQIGEREGLFVRGGTGEETRQFIDGTLLKHPNYSSVPGIPQYARINPFLFKGILFSSGGYSAQYGQAMSSALILESVDLPEKSSASYNIFPANLGAGFQRLAKNQQSSYGMGVSYSNHSVYNRVVPQQPDYFLGPKYASTDANFRIKTSKTGMLKIYTTGSMSRIGLRRPDIDSLSLQSSYRLRNDNVYLNLSYREFLNENWRVDAGTAYSYNQDDVRTGLLSENDQSIELKEEPFQSKNSNRFAASHFGQGRVVFTRFFNRNQALRIGGEQFYFRDQFRYNEAVTSLTDHLSAAFAEADVYLTGNLAARVGARLEYSSLLASAVAAPRLSLAYRIKEGEQVNLAYGIFYQKPETQYLSDNRNLGFSSASHYVLNYSKRASNRFFRAEIYYKRYQNLLKTVPVVQTGGQGYAQGIEFFWRDKKTIKNLDYWVTYTYLDTRREFLNYPAQIRPTFAAPHTATVAIKRFFQDLNTSVNVSYAFAAGRPYYDIRSGLTKETTHIFDQGRTKAYSVLNLHVAYLTRFFKKGKVKDFSGIAFGANNILGTRQVFGYQYSYNGLHKMPITLPAPRMYFLGLFMSFGIDRTDDIMNTNL